GRRTSAPHRRTASTVASESASLAEYLSCPEYSGPLEPNTTARRLPGICLSLERYLYAQGALHFHLAVGKRLLSPVGKRFPVLIPYHRARTVENRQENLIFDGCL